MFKYLAKKHQELHGPFIKTNDSPDAARSTVALTQPGQERRHRRHQHSGPVELVDQQSAFTPVVNQMKQDGSNWSDNGLTTPGAVLLRQEAALQGVDSSKVVWQCTSACYDEKAMAAAATP